LIRTDFKTSFEQGRASGPLAPAEGKLANSQAGGWRYRSFEKASKHNLPPRPRGLLNTWRGLAAVQKIQKQNPTDQHAASLPKPVPAR
jgi:hypothetical protein